MSETLYKRKLLVSFSGGETSAFMAQWLWRNKRDEYDMIFVFANTGEENEETLNFINRCSRHFGFPVTWVEAKVFHNERRGTQHTEVDFLTASREGQPFEQVIKKYGIPNQSTPHCTRELKERPIKDFARSTMGWEDYYLAIGIRNDEIDRMNNKKDAMRIIYPLIYMKPMNKAAINFYWSNMPFRLELRGWEGNCKTCWKKSDKKLFKIAQDDERKFLFFQKMELRYDKYIPDSRRKLIEQRGGYAPLVTRFFRGNRTVEDIINGSKLFNGIVDDDSTKYPNPEIIVDEGNLDLDNGSCEVFSSCSET